MHVPHACINYIYFRGRRGVMCMCTLLRAAHSMGPAARGVSLHGVSCTMGCPWGVHGVSMGCHMYPHDSMRGCASPPHGFSQGPCHVAHRRDAFLPLTLGDRIAAGRLACRLQWIASLTTKEHRHAQKETSNERLIPPLHARHC